MMRINVGSLRYSPSCSAWIIATEDRAKAEMLHYGDGDVIICPWTYLTSFCAVPRNPS
jgi:hypothetical protein